MRLSFVCCLLVACGHVETPPAAECSTAAECPAATPFCVDQACTDKCAVSTDCTNPDTPICAADGACVACETSDQCTADAPICDADTRSCRGCEKDAECPGGVCVESGGGSCVADADVAFVTMMGNDMGTCTRAAPCATIQFAVQQAGARRVIHVLGGTIFTTSTINLGGNFVLDGEDTILSFPNAQPAVQIGPQGGGTFEGFRLTAPPMQVPAIVVTGAVKGILRELTIDSNGGVALRMLNSADVNLVLSHIGGLGSMSGASISCENSKLLAAQNVFETTVINDGGTQCEATVFRNRFESPRDGSVQITGGQVVMENNLIIHSGGFNDSILATNLRPGSTIRFNTIVNTTALPSDGAALSCDNTVEVTSNIFAYNSGHPITGQTCATKFSVFDDVATTSAGTGNQVTGIDTIFVDRATGDYHLADGSIAKGAAEPGQTMVKVDFEGNPRPNPAGSTSDSGAFEAP